MRYGRFSEDGKEFIIENVATPKPWINYIYNCEYFSTISNNGGGISYHKNPLHGRITRYRINDVPYDRPGKYIYLRDRETGDIWSLTWQPVGRNPEAYRVTHGFGYTRVSAKVAEINSQVDFFVPRDHNSEIWQTVLKNESDRIRNLSVFAYVELSLGHALVDLINQCDDQHFNRVYFDRDLNALFATKTYWLTEKHSTQQQENKAWDQWVYFTSNIPVSGYETVRERFIGLYRNENNPEAVELDRLSNQDTDFGNAIGALKFEIELQPGEKKEIVINLGIIAKTEFSDKKKSEVERFQNVENVAQSFVAVKQSWEKILSSVKVTTPDRNTNIFLNYWTPYQARVAFDIGRVASFYYWGISRGFGFRDTAQDVLAVSISDPEKARERILLLARQMFSSGRVFHHFYKDGQGETTRHCDDPLWFIFAVTEYLKETGDMEIVNRVEPFVDQKSGTILDHLKAVLQFVKNNLGAHHLPVFGRGDWNDTLDYIGGDDGGESVWGGMFYVVMLNDLIELLSVLQETITRQEAEKLCNMIRDSINKNCWDGDWFIRAFGDNGKKIGSKSNKYGKIFLNPQAWAVLGNVAEKGKLQKAMASARHHLDTEFGPKICVPAFREIDPAIGLVTRCVAGKKENGAVFYHPTTWAIQAECLLGHGDIAYQYYRKLLPNSIDSDRFQTEPYVYPQYITSDEHPTAGMASHSWQTGTAAWMYRVAIDYMLGVRATYQGLLIDPVIPSHWPEFSMERIYRGTRYMIHVVNPDHVERGIKEIVVDGRKVKTAVLAISNRKICSVDVVMG